MRKEITLSKRGRPRLPDDERLSENVRIMLTSDQFALLERVSREQNVSMSAVVRKVILNYLEERNG